MFLLSIRNFTIPISINFEIFNDGGKNQSVKELAKDARLSPEDLQIKFDAKKEKSAVY